MTESLNTPPPETPSISIDALEVSKLSAPSALVTITLTKSESSFTASTRLFSK